MGNIATSDSLYDLLASQLPKDVAFTFYHYSTPPSKSPPLFSAPPNVRSERTFCESHFLAASITLKDAAGSKSTDELLVLAIEVLVYTTKRLTTIFVSKADSTGYLSLLNLPRSQAGSPLKGICGTFVSWLARQRQREGKKVVVSLFARAQDQYLFPASVENKDKHVLDDRGLVKWWCQVLDPIVREYEAEGETKTLTERLANGADHTSTIQPSVKSESTAKGYLVVPGFEPNDTLRYIPPPPTPTAPRRWAVTHPLLQIAPHPGAPPRCLVPHFPDDPKARFLDELDEELPDRGTDAMVMEGGTPSRSNGQWKSVKTLDQFWEFMAFRQECSSGRIVGFIWIVISPPQPSIPEEDEEGPSQAVSSFSQDESQAFLKTSSSSSSKRKQKKDPRARRVNTEYGPIPLILPRIKSSSSGLSAMLDGSGSAVSRLPPESSPWYIWPTSSRGTVIFSAKDYERAHQVLLQQNFATKATAARSTTRWKEEIAVLGGVDSWSRTVVGRKEAPIASATALNGTAPAILLGVRKKRKPDAPAEPEPKPAGGPTILGEGLVRKKVKVDTPEPVAGTTAANGVNTLGAGLVRKKPKN
ncbi:DNA damage response protein-like protein Rtt109 [Lentithecium fluviatile CBS 122367]|uniref:histone acetyltransferase n=1 Tax=Lentithecium fluviatile CBS 122367 TaxID=1168545 RepID=A0A6G1J3R2_9PLEO|nr:DNA damage response protein-like protein Rtt109 [Lentithecium fluviatile CBS 122367]